MKATHQGTCQICGRVQKLPGGLLAKHGYTVNYGWFNGTCQGSGFLPMPDVSILVPHIEALKNYEIKLLGTVKKAHSLDPATQEMVSYRVSERVTTPYRQTVYHEGETRRENITVTYNKVAVTMDDGRVLYEEGYFDKDLHSYIKRRNNAAIQKLQSQLKSLWHGIQEAETRLKEKDKYAVMLAA